MTACVLVLSPRLGSESRVAGKIILLGAEGADAIMVRFLNGVGAHAATIRLSFPGVGRRGNRFLMQANLSRSQFVCTIPGSPMCPRAAWRRD